jgi:hypothetical protein
MHARLSCPWIIAYCGGCERRKNPIVVPIYARLSVINGKGVGNPRLPSATTMCRGRGTSRLTRRGMSKREIAASLE